MKPAQLQAIIRHGQSLLEAFPNAADKDPLALCKKLRRIETKAHRFATDYCNGEISSADGRTFYRQHGHAPGPFLTEAIPGPDSYLLKVFKLLGIPTDHPASPFLNMDARGYALKLDDEWTREHNQQATIRIHSDWGGYGILAPEIND